MTGNELDEGVEAGAIVGLTIYRTQEGEWQASCTVDRVSWRVAIAGTPSEALAALLPAAEPDFMQ